MNINIQESQTKHTKLKKKIEIINNFDNSNNAKLTKSYILEVYQGC